MQLPTEEQLTHYFKVLEKLLKEPLYTTAESKEILLRLLADPNIEFSKETSKEYGILKSFLLNPNPSVQQLTQFAISLAILSLSEEGKIIADRIRSATGSQNADLDLSGTRLHRLAAADWQAFGKALASSKLTSLSLEGNLSSLEATSWQVVFWSALASSKLTSLSLMGNNLSHLEAASWRAFCGELASSKLTSLSLSQNKLSSLEAAGWQAFGKALVSSRLTSLYLGGNDLSRLETAGWQAFCDVLASSKLTSLDLWDNNLSSLEATGWQTFCSALASSKLTSLDLSVNKLSHLGVAGWQVFCDALASSKLTSLDLGGNDLSRLETAGWRAFGRALASSKLTSLYLGGNDLDQLEAAHWQELIIALKDNFNLQIEGLPDELSPQLDILLKRNRLLKDVCTKAIKVIDLKSDLNEKEFLARIEDAFRLLSQGLSLVQGITTPNADEMRKQLQNYIDELNYKKGCYLREHLVHDQDVTPMLAAWVNISAQSARFEEGHMQAFEFVYASTYNSGAPPAFMEALPYLLNEKGELIKLDENHQIIFDGYLFAAAGGKEQFEKRKLSPEERLSLLQYVLLMDIKKQRESPASANTQFFAQERQAGLGNLLGKNLPVIDPGHLDPDVEKRIANLWQDVSNRLDKMPLEENKKAVVAAIKLKVLETAQMMPKVVK